LPDCEGEEEEELSEEKKKKKKKKNCGFFWKGGRTDGRGVWTVVEGEFGLGGVEW